MPNVFVSHASADATFVDHFVDDVIKLGCELPKENIFYSSRTETGVPSGEDLMSYVRSQVGATELVIAIITPTYLTRPVCMAELGAGWGQVGKLFPLLTRGVNRKALEGILPPMLIRYVDEEEVLDELKDEIGRAINKVSSAATWGRYSTKWLTSVDEYAKSVKVPETATPQQVKSLEAEVAKWKNALQDTVADVDTLNEQIARLKELKDEKQVAKVLVSGDATAHFRQLVSAVAKVLAELGDAVAEAIRWDQAVGEDMTIPTEEEDWSLNKKIWDAIAGKELILHDDVWVKPNYDFPLQEEAKFAIGELSDFLSDPDDPNFESWFRQTYKLPMDLGAQKVWNALF